MALNIDDIKTVNDLINAQEVEPNISDADDIVLQLLDLDPSVGLEVTCRVIYALRELHANATEKYIKEGNPEYAAQWAADCEKLNMALNTIKDIQL